MKWSKKPWEVVLGEIDNCVEKDKLGSLLNTVHKSQIKSQHKN